MKTETYDCAILLNYPGSLDAPVGAVDMPLATLRRMLTALEETPGAHDKSIVSLNTCLVIKKGKDSIPRQVRQVYASIEVPSEK
jgi:hypothetical protein